MHFKSPTCAVPRGMVGGGDTHQTVFSPCVGFASCRPAAPQMLRLTFPDPMVLKITQALKRPDDHWCNGAPHCVPTSPDHFQPPFKPLCSLTCLHLSTHPLQLCPTCLNPTNCPLRRDLDRNRNMDAASLLKPSKENILISLTPHP